MVSRPREWPVWWWWELDLSSTHLAKRMRDRQFDEPALREMLELATGFYPDHEPGRWVVVTQWQRVSWEVIVEPVADERVLLVVTAYPLET